MRDPVALTGPLAICVGDRVRPRTAGRALDLDRFGKVRIEGDLVDETDDSRIL